MGEVARVVFAPPHLCHRRLRPGEVKRILPRGTLVGYYLRSPCCASLCLVPGAWVETGWMRSTWEGATREPKHNEEDAPIERVEVEHPAELRHVGFMCQGCGQRLEVADGVIGPAR